DCPVQVDMATYKAEFLSHYYEGRIRPRYAYASGLIYWWSRVAARMPATANFFTQTPGLNRLAKLAAGYSQRRHIPPFAPQTFRAGTPIVGLEPSCMTVFRDELPNLLYGDEDAKRLSAQSFILSEFLATQVPGYKPPTLRRKARVHGHCHQKSELGFEGEVELM